MAADLIRGALGAHVSKEFGMASEPGRVIRRGATVAAIAWVPWAAGIVLTNVVFPTRQDHDGLWVPLGYLLIFAALAFAGLTRASGRAG